MTSGPDHLPHDTLREAAALELRQMLARNRAMLMLIDLVQHLEANQLPHVVRNDSEGRIILAIPGLLSQDAIQQVARSPSSLVAGATSAPDGAAAPSGAPEPIAETADARVSPPAAAAQGPGVRAHGDTPGPAFVTGPYLEFEIDRVVEMLAEDATKDAIALALNRDPRGVHIAIARAKKRLATDHAPRPYTPRPRQASAHIPADPPAPPQTPPAVASRPPEPDGAATPSGALSAPAGRSEALPHGRGRSEAGKSGIRRELAIYLDTCGHPDPWTPAKDLDLAECIVRGDGIAGAAMEIQIPSDDCRARWQELTRLIRAEKGLTIDGQAALMAELRERAGGAA